MALDRSARFLRSVGGPLSAGDLPTVLGRLHDEWPPQALVVYLDASSLDVVRTAAVCLGLSGTVGHGRHLLPLLGHSDEAVAAAAENALWHLWMRAGSPQGNRLLAAGIRQIGACEYSAAIETLTALLDGEPTFAEAHHQRAIALHLLERLDEAARDYEQALRLNRQHFAAAAGLGHVLVEQTDLPRALQHYKRAVRINPRMPEIRQAIADIEAAARPRVVA